MEGAVLAATQHSCYERDRVVERLGRVGIGGGGAPRARRSRSSSASPSTTSARVPRGGARAPERQGPSLPRTHVPRLRAAVLTSGFPSSATAAAASPCTATASTPSRAVPCACFSTASRRDARGSRLTPPSSPRSPETIPCYRARTMGCPWDNRTSLRAACGTTPSHLACLKYAHAHGCAWDERVFVDAAATAPLKTLRYLLTRLPLRRVHHAECAAAHGRLDVLETFPSNAKSGGVAVTSAAASRPPALPQVRRRDVTV